MSGTEFWVWFAALTAGAWITWRVLLMLAASFDDEYREVRDHRRQMDALAPEDRS
jgi:hypothetical protein